MWWKQSLRRRSLRKSWEGPMSTRPSQVEEKRRESSSARYQSTFPRESSSITLAVSNLTDRHYTPSFLLIISFLCFFTSLSLSLSRCLSWCFRVWYHSSKSHEGALWISSPKQPGVSSCEADWRLQEQSRRKSQVCNGWVLIRLTRLIRLVWCSTVQCRSTVQYRSV